MNAKATVGIVVAAVVAVIVTSSPKLAFAPGGGCNGGCIKSFAPGGAAPLAVSGANVYTAWNNASVTLHGVPIFFTKSNNGGKTFANTMVISTPNTNPKTFVINKNISISASGNNVAVTWWTNKTGIFNPVIRTSSDGGDTFAAIVKLISTPGGINK